MLSGMTVRVVATTVFVLVSRRSKGMQTHQALGPFKSHRQFYFSTLFFVLWVAMARDTVQNVGLHEAMLGVSKRHLSVHLSGKR